MISYCYRNNDFFFVCLPQEVLSLLRSVPFLLSYLFLSVFRYFFTASLFYKSICLLFNGQYLRLTYISPWTYIDTVQCYAKMQMISG